MTDETCPHEDNATLQAKEVREHLEHLRILHARMMGHPLPPLRSHRERMRVKRKLPAPRKPSAPKRISTTIRLHPQVLNAFKADGPGWQTRINQALLDFVAKKA